MTEQTFRRILFVALLLAAPSLLFLAVVIFVVPPVFLLAGLAYMVVKLFTDGFGMENLAFFAILLLHVLIFGGVYYLVARLAGKLAGWLPAGWPRRVLLGALLAGLGLLTQLPIYGGGGHGPSTFGPLQEMLAELEKNYGQGSAPTVYLAAIALACLPMLRGWWRRRRQETSRP